MFGFKELILIKVINIHYFSGNIKKLKNLNEAIKCLD